MKLRLLCLILFAALSVTAGEKSPKYIFLFIGDGMSLPQRQLAEEFSRLQYGKGLAINSFPVTAVTRTCSGNSLVTDSAASATAIACGEKTANRRVGLDASAKRKLESSAVFAKKQGRKVGIVSSVTIIHATPAGFYAHQPDRNMYYEIGQELVASGFDYFGGGGCAGFNKTGRKKVEYSGNIYEKIKNAGYKLAMGRSEFDALKADDGKVCAFADHGALPLAIDRREDTQAPSLAEFTAKGIKLLDNPNGFFMMVEGGCIDWVCHSHDTAAVVREVIDFDNAVKTAVDFAARHPDETLIVVTGDHETGGMTLGMEGKAFHPAVLAAQKCSVAVFNGIINRKKKANRDFDFEQAKPLLTEYFGFDFSGQGPLGMKEKNIENLKKAFKKGRLGDAAAKIIQYRAGIGWTTGGHSGLPVITSSYGCGADTMSGFFENSDISVRLKKLMQ